jgi:hypoxanthine phosphoribosyltransferase
MKHTIFLTEDQIQEICKNLGAQLTEKFKGKTPLFVGILKGCHPFMSDLLKYVDCDLTIDYMQVSSYEGAFSTGNVKIKKDLDYDISGRDVVIIEDIIDTGTTMHNLKNILSQRNPKSITIVSFLDKPSRRKIEINADFVGKTIDDLFVIGYGFDYNQKYRNLPFVTIYEGEDD